MDARIRRSAEAGGFTTLLPQVPRPTPIDESAATRENRYAQGTAPNLEEQMTGTAMNILLLCLLVLGSVLLVFGPLAALAVMFWHWRKELRESSRLRQARSTQVR